LPVQQHIQYIYSSNQQELTVSLAFSFLNSVFFELPKKIHEVKKQPHS